MWDKYTTTSMHYAIKLPNGSSIWFRGGNSNEIATDEAYITFFIDINGQNLPNTVGKDMFSFKYEKGGLKPCGAPGSALANTWQPGQGRLGMCIHSPTESKYELFTLT